MNVQDWIDLAEYYAAEAWIETAAGYCFLPYASRGAAQSAAARAMERLAGDKSEARLARRRKK